MCSRPAVRTAKGCGSRAGRRSAIAGCPSSTCRRPGPNRWSTTSCGLSVAFNGCIYNYQQLRDELDGYGYRFFSTSDTEVVLKAYHRWGTGFVEHFKGMFAIALVELDTGRLVLARDRLGIKPLYVADTADRLRFASSLPALLAAGDIDTTIDVVALHHYMTFHSVVPPPRTILNGVRKLPPATVRVVEPDGRSIDTVYWVARARPGGAVPRADRRRLADLVLESLRVSVERRMVADVPVGVLLSGGIDSSLVVALLADAGQHGPADVQHRLRAGRRPRG